MSRADWGFLERLLEEGQEYSTGIGRVWLTVLFLFRMLVLGTAAESAWDDEQSDFLCNTQQPGCELVCYDRAFPISHFRYFVMQVIFVSTPTMFYFIYVALRMGWEKKREEEEARRRAGEGGRSPDEAGARGGEEEGSKRGEGKGVGGEREGPKLKGKLLCAYAFSILLKLLLEVGFVVGLWYLYGFVIHAKYVCQRAPCSHKVDCFVSRPTEKTIFTIYMQVIAAVSVLLNIAELFYLLQRAVTQYLEKKYLGKAPVTVQIDREPVRLDLPREPAVHYHDKGHLYLPNSGFPQPFQEYGEPEIRLEWDVRDQGATEGSLSNPLPSYSTCMRAIRSTSSRASSKGSSHKEQSKKSKKRDFKQKHYV
ncbi:gap junction protein alpha 4 [Conger conger]|uniref:gap junction protein alpha 4 n=1 Tax=Conger conger TaxID=82655 RepID=UPI002A599399|nr:gap junction protein alpha 4 [Conger conger]